MLPLDNMSMVMVFHFINLERLIHVHNQVGNRLEIHLMEDHQEEDHLIETHLEDHDLIHLLDFTNDRHLIQGCSCHHGTNRL
jgi:hypothetical protein